MLFACTEKPCPQSRSIPAPRAANAAAQRAPADSRSSRNGARAIDARNLEGDLPGSPRWSCRIAAAGRSRAGAGLRGLRSTDTRRPRPARSPASVARRDAARAQVVEDALARIAARDPVLNAFTDVTPSARSSAPTRSMRHTATGETPGPLAGVPFAVKNLFDIEGLPTRAGSKINRELPPAAHDAPLIERLEAAGAVLVGALNMGEYAYDFTGENVHDGPSRNPHALTRMTGGSSGGSGGAVAAGLVPLALGSDTNGSIRVPSSLLRPVSA